MRPSVGFSWAHSPAKANDVPSTTGSGTGTRYPRLTRRNVFTLAAGISAALALSTCSGEDTGIRLGAAQYGGQFHEFAAALAAAAAEHSSVRIEPIVSEGSVTNLSLLADGGIDAALALGDAVPADTGALAVGRVHECYIQVAVHPDSSVRELGDLRGGRIDLGLTGSGSAETGQRLLRAAGLVPHIDLMIEHRDLSAGVRALLDGRIDALLWGDEVPTPVFEFPVRLRLLDLGEWVPAMYSRYGYPYDTVAVPVGTYPGAAAVDTIGVPTLLLVSPDLPGRVVTSLADLLLNHGGLLVPARTVGVQFLDRQWLVGTGKVPLHPAAADLYRAAHG